VRDRNGSVTEHPILSPNGKRTAVLIPGTGSDEVFVRSVYEIPLAAVGIPAVMPAPHPGTGLGEAYLAELDAAAARNPDGILAGGISFGAHLAAEWALRNPGRCAGLLLALPAWHGDPGDSPAAVAARLAADTVRAEGLESALTSLTGSADAWLAKELARAWRGYGDGLADSLRAAADRPAPTLDDLATLDIPAGIAGCPDDQVHPLTVAREWTKALNQAELRTTRLDIIGADPEALGRATVLAWLRAAGLA
jgi:pimeloyl-ACP methyl ester carboxylesterase